MHDDDEGDREDKNDKADKAEDGAEEDAADAEDGLRRVYALGYVGSPRSLALVVRVRGFTWRAAAKVTGNTAHKGALGEITRDFARCSSASRPRRGAS